MTPSGGCGGEQPQNKTGLAVAGLRPGGAEWGPRGGEEVGGGRQEGAGAAQGVLIQVMEITEQCRGRDDA